jgi:phospholipase/carboxylesterase
MSSLAYQERPAAGDPAGLLILHHGRGADERDLLGLADVLDPQQRLHVVTPRAPLSIGGGFHWYVVPRVGHPDPSTFHDAYDRLAAFHDELWQRTGITPAQTVLGGFSMGSVMSYALGLPGDRPKPAGILVFSGFVPTVNGWEPELASRSEMPVFIAHGRRDPIIDVEFARRARALLEAGRVPVEYHESDAAHHIDPAHISPAVGWLTSVTTPSAAIAADAVTGDDR